MGDERTIALASANDLLMEQWHELQSGGADEKQMKFAMGYLFAIYQLGGLDDAAHEGWRERFKRCPDGGPASDHRPLSWCAYCGQVGEQACD